MVMIWSFNGDYGDDVAQEETEFAMEAACIIQIFHTHFFKRKKKKTGEVSFVRDSPAGP